MTFVRSVVIPVTLTSLTSVACVAAEIPEVEFRGPATISDYLRAYVDAPEGPPSISIAVAKGGEIVLAEAVGLADIGDEVAATTTTPYRTYSISKGITAVAVLQLEEQGKLALDDDIRKYVPEFPEKRWPVRIKHLLTHTSGIRHYKENAGEISSTVEYPTLADSLVVFKDSPLAFEPGTDYLYTTFGFNLLTGAIESATGKSFSEVLAESVFGPAGMIRSALDVAGARPPGIASLYGWWMGRHREFDEVPNVSGRYGSSGVVSTPTDLVRLFLALERGDLMKSETVERMFAEWDPEIAESQALGWNNVVENGQRYVYRTGGGSGSTGIVEYLPEFGVIGAVLINMNPYEGRVPILERVLDYYVETADR